jgi:hypothetical protein
MKKFTLGLLLGAALCGFVWWFSTHGFCFWMDRPDWTFPVRRSVPEEKSPAPDGWTCTLDDHMGSLVTFSHAGESHSLRAEPKTAWSDPIINAEGTVLFVILHDRYATDYNAFTFRAVVRYELSPPGRPWSDPVKTTLIDAPELAALTGSPRAWIERLHSISDDGQRILVTAGFEDPSTSSAEQTISDRQPYIYNIAEKKLTKVRP